MAEGGVIITRPNGREEYRVHAGDCAESVKKKLKGDVAVREIVGRMRRVFLNVIS